MNEEDDGPCQKRVYRSTERRNGLRAEMNLRGKSNVRRNRYDVLLGRGNRRKR